MASIIRPSFNARQLCRWHPFPDAASLEYAAAETIFNAAQSAIKQRGEFHIVLAGGNTPRHVYELLRNAVTDWRHWHIYFGDERCLPPNHAERNSVMAADAWLSHVEIPAQHIHPIPAESGAQSAAGTYAQVLEYIELFDISLLGLGEDGHTASLFPQRDAGSRPDSPAVLAVHDAPKPPPERVSLSAQRLSRSRQVLFLVTGDAKKPALKDWRSGRDIPAASICPDNGVDIYVEEKLLIK